MQAYGLGFAQIYNQRWSGFAQQVAPLIQAFFEKTAARADKTLLDLCCGTGQLSAHFLEQGYRVTGIDLSEAMLQFAKENLRQYIESGQAELVHADAANFRLNDQYSLVVSTFDSLNHLPDEEALKKCFQCVFRVCSGIFIFDLNTRTGLRRWNSIAIDDSSDDALIITRGIFDGQSDKAWTNITGFSRTPDGLYERFDETAFNTVFGLAKVKRMLLELGWHTVYFARASALDTPLDDPEAEGRVFVVAVKDQ